MVLQTKWLTYRHGEWRIKNVNFINMRFCSLHRGRGSRIPWWWQHCSPLINQRKTQGWIQILRPMLKNNPCHNKSCKRYDDCASQQPPDSLCPDGGWEKRKLFLKPSSHLTVNCIAFILPRFMVHSTWKETVHVWKREKVGRFYPCIPSVRNPPISTITASSS